MEKNALICMECAKVAQYLRRTQFAGDHPYCEIHAKAEKDFMKEDSYTFWQTVKEYNKRRE